MASLNAASPYRAVRRWGNPGHLEGALRDGNTDPVEGLLIGTVGEGGLRIGQQRRRLLRKGGRPTRVGESRRLRDMAELVEREIQLMPDAGIRRVAIVVVVERLALTRSEHRIGILLPGLNQTDRIRAVGNRGMDVLRLPFHRRRRPPSGSTSP